MYKPDLALNNLQWLIYHNTKPNQKLKYSSAVNLLATLLFLFQLAHFEERV